MLEGDKEFLTWVGGKYFFRIFIVHSKKINKALFHFGRFVRRPKHPLVFISVCDLALWKLHKQPVADFLQNMCSWNFAKINRKTLVLDPLLQLQGYSLQLH